VQELVTKFFPCKVTIWLESLDILEVKVIQTEVVHCSADCCLWSTKLIGNSLDASNRTVLYQFQHIILHLDSVFSSSFTLSLWDSISLSDILVHIGEHSPVRYSVIRKSLLTFFNCCTCFSITEAIHVHNVGIFLVGECSH
jgi:hypothetical protein